LTTFLTSRTIGDQEKAPPPLKASCGTNAQYKKHGISICIHHGGLTHSKSMVSYAIVIASFLSLSIYRLITTSRLYYMLSLPQKSIHIPEDYRPELTRYPFGVQGNEQ
jgi:hypothetical protein